MGKAVSLVAALALVFVTLMPRHGSPLVRAQSAAPLPCGSQSSASPMQGHYTGPWHSDGDYHFAAFNTDIELKVAIDGTLDLTVTPNGHVTGTAIGKVDAPVYDYGQKDISSGTGTISGSVTGFFSSTGSLLVLSHPVIDMHWGTFVGGGYTVERFISMPDYQLPLSSTACVSASGTVNEMDFPVQNLTVDSTGQMTQTPGVGAATGTWQVTSDESAQFSNLSQQVDSFIAAANTVLSSESLTPMQVQARILQPLAALETAIGQSPNIARCLLEKLAAWEEAGVTGMYSRASAAHPVDLASFRLQGDLLRAASALNMDCHVSDGGFGDRLQTAELNALAGALAAPDWSRAMLLIRELLLFRGTQVRGQVQDSVNIGLHTRLQSSSDSSALLEVARLAYVLDDDADAHAAYVRLAAHGALSTQLHAHKKKRKKGTKPKPRATPTPKPSPTSKPTSTPKTLEQVLSGGITRIDGHSSGADPTFSWQPVNGAVRYLVTVSDAHNSLLWSWSGTATSVDYGGTAVDGMPGTEGEGWPIALPSSYTWTVTALDVQGHLVGIKLR